MPRRRTEQLHFFHTERRRRVAVFKRVIPRQRAVFNAAARIRGDIAKKLLEALKAMQGNVNLSEVARLLPVATTDEVFRAMGVDGIEAVTVGLEAELQRGLVIGGRMAAQEAGSVAVLDLNRAAVRRWMGEHTAEMVTNISSTSRRAVSLVVNDGVMRARPPRLIARDLKGTLGLTEPHAQAVINRRIALEGAGVPRAKVDRIIDKYSNQLLEYRAKMIARTESLAAVNNGRLRLWQQLEADGALPAGVENEWITSVDERVCEICSPMDGQRRELGDQFVGGDGSTAEAPPIHPQCRCSTALVVK